MNTPGSKSTVHLAETAPGEIDPSEGLDTDHVNEDQSITEPLPLPEAGPHESGERAIARLAASSQRPAPPEDPATADVGSSARYPKTSLLEWLGLIELGCRDAIIAVQADDGRDGRLWCVRGEIVDAEWGPLKGAAAADRILSFREGDISVAFGPVERSRVISSTTGFLLIETAQRTVGSGAISPSPIKQVGVSERHDPQLSALVAPGLASGIHSEVPVARTNRPSAPVARPASRQTPYMAGALAGGAIAFAIWQWSAPPAKPQATAAARAARPVTVQPVADSRLMETPVNVGDGLPVLPEEPELAGGGERLVRPSAERQRHARTESTRIKRAPGPSPQRQNADDAQARRNEALAKARMQQAADTARSKAELADTSKPKFQIIEPLQPKVQIIEPPTPKVQIIEPLKSKLDPADVPQVKLIE
jgi:hypothetical protein